MQSFWFLYFSNQLRNLRLFHCKRIKSTTDCRVLWRQALPCKMRIGLRETQVNQQTKMKETKYILPLHNHRIEATPTTLQQTSSRLDVMQSTAPGGRSRDQSRRPCRSTPILCRIDICIILSAADDGFCSYPILSPTLASLPACHSRGACARW